MPVVTPTSGAVVLATDVTGVHEAARSVANAESPSRMLPEALGPMHLPGLVVGKDKVDFTSFNVTTAPATLEVVADIIALWQDPAALYVNGGGAGYALPACILFYWTTIRMQEFVTSLYASDHQVWANLYYVKGGADQTKLINSRMIYGQLPSAGSMRETEDTITIFDAVEEPTAFTLNRVGVRFALNRGGSAAAVPFFTVGNGQVGFVALYRES